MSWIQLRSLALLFVLIALQPWVQAQETPPSIQWKVANRFTLFEHARDFERIERLWLQHGSAQALIDSPGFTKSLRELLPIRETAWRPQLGTYHKPTLFPDSHVVVARAIGSTAGTLCKWISDGQEVANRDCSEGVEIRVPSGRTFSIKVEGTNSYSAELPNSIIQERLIVALGDSFASGEGNPDHPAVYRPVAPSVDWPFQKTAGRHLAEDAAWWDETCHRSLISWPAMAALGQSVTNPHAVVQFASFACSGSEIYDGIFRAQVNPPGWDQSSLVRDMFERDGGPGYRWNGKSYSPPQCTGGDCRALKLSQMNALAHLVCPSGGIKSDTFTKIEPTEGHSLKQTLFGSIKIPRCSNARKIDQTLISIGGNDVGFSGIVRWLITPPNGKNAFNTFFLGLSRQIGGVLEPPMARKSIHQLGAMYKHLGDALNRLEISPQSVRLLEYPDPTQGPLNFKQCNARTRDGNAPFQSMIKDGIKNSNFLFGINQREFETVRTQFIEPLQQVQTQELPKGWKIIKSQPAFNNADGSPSSYCAVSKSCTSSSCPNGERTRWWTSLHYAAEPRLEKLSDYDPYDSTRSRGMRYAVDALLTSAARNSTGGLHRNWLTSTAHPTGNVHARIADLVNSLENQPQQSTSSQR